MPGRAGLRGENVEVQISCLVPAPSEPSLSGSTLTSGPRDSNLLSEARWAILSRETILMRRMPWGLKADLLAGRK